MPDEFAPADTSSVYQLLHHRRPRHALDIQSDLVCILTKVCMCLTRSPLHPPSGERVCSMLYYAADTVTVKMLVVHGGPDPVWNVPD